MACTSFLPHRTLAFKEGAPRVLSRAQRAAYRSPVFLPAGSVLATYLGPEGLPRGNLTHSVGRTRS